MAHPDLMIDTSVVIDHLRKRNKRKSALFAIVDGYSLHTPTVVEFELFAGATNAEKRQDIEYILQLCTSVPLNSEVARHAGQLYRRLRRKNKLLEIRDLFIASSAVVHGLTLMTFNTEHFQRVDGLNLLAPPSPDATATRTSS